MIALEEIFCLENISQILLLTAIKIIIFYFVHLFILFHVSIFNTCPKLVLLTNLNIFTSSIVTWLNQRHPYIFWKELDLTFTSSDSLFSWVFIWLKKIMTKHQHHWRTNKGHWRLQLNHTKHRCQRQQKLNGVTCFNVTTLDEKIMPGNNKIQSVSSIK